MNLVSKKGIINLTGRTKILSKDIKIEVDWSGKYPKIISDTFSLELPSEISSESRVFIDVTQTYNYQSFDLGTKADIRLPEDLLLDKFRHDKIIFLIRVTNPLNPGLLSSRSAPYPVKPPSDKPPRKGETFSLLRFERIDLDQGVPMRIDFPSITGSSNPVTIQINKRECDELYLTLDEQEQVYHALILPPHLVIIIERLAFDVSRGIFDPSERVSKNSSWQSHWNYLFSNWTGKGLVDLDTEDPTEISLWRDDIISHWSLIVGNPAKRISRHLGGVRK